MLEYIFTLIISILSFLNVSLTDSTELQGRVVAVKDGDTIEILTSNLERITIRLDEIDCPERKQAFGQRAKQFTSDFCFGKMVKIVGAKKDRYKRTLAYVYNLKGRNLNYELVKNGMAWKYKHSRNKELQALQDIARFKKVGLWIDKKPIAPWDFRSKKY